MKIDLRFRFVASTAWLSIAGAVDAYSHAELARRLLDLGRLECSVLHLDVGGLTHIEPESLHAIDEARRAMVDRGATFDVTVASTTFTLASLMCGYTDLAAHARVAGRVPASELPPYTSIISPTIETGSGRHL